MTDMSIQSTAGMRRYNRKLVLSEIYRRATVSRTKLAASTSLTATAITRITRELIAAGLVVEGAQLPRNGVPGRKETQLSISGAIAHVIGISLHADNRSIALADVQGAIKDFASLDIPYLASPDRAIRRIADLTRELIGRNHLHCNQVIGIALALAGKIDPLNGLVVDSRIYQWENVPIRDLLSSQTGLAVSIENLNNVVNLSESLFGHSRGCDNVLILRIGTGYVGASLMLDGRLVRSRNSAAGLINHVPLNINDIECECGHLGCINTVSSGFGILARMDDESQVLFKPKNLSSHNRRLGQIIDSASRGDARPQRILREGGFALGMYTAQLCEAIYPEVVIVAGRVGRCRHYMEGFVEAWNEFASSENRSAVRIIQSNKSVTEQTIDFAIERFLLSMDLDLEPLMHIFNSFEQEAV